MLNKALSNSLEGTRAQALCNAWALISSNACDLGLYPTHSGKCAMMEPALLGSPSDGIPGRMCHQWPSV
jgi:hypothetical protein